MSDPLAVRDNRRYLESLMLWHRVTTNECAKSCGDAASKRRRLGNVGIPLFDELKSHAAAYDDPSGRRYVICHCRGNQARDDAKISEIVGQRTERLTEVELTERFDLGYGLINPFFFARQEDVRQVFDSTVLEQYFTPHTMMTNLGHCEYGVEFVPGELVEALPNVTVADIVTADSPRRPREHAIGILTGNGPESGMELWRQLNERVFGANKNGRFGGDIGYPAVTIRSIPSMGMSMELPERAATVRATVLSGIEDLLGCGATLIGIACNTTQYFSHEIGELCTQHNASFVSMVHVTRRALQAHGVRSFDLLGIGAVSDLAGWSDFRHLSPEFDVHVPRPTAVKQITELAFKIKKQDEPKGADVTTLSRLIKESADTDTVLLALTELSLLVERFPVIREKSGKRFLDTLGLLAECLADTYLAERHKAEARARDAEREPTR
jgi:aspartate/glutamate racemase